jgi:hypothetical protein|nr:MAG TPA: hypothetical protein [Caudoviricetes sp.]
MAKQLTDLQRIPRTGISSDDLIWIRDMSDNRDKKATIGDVFGRPLEGWISVVGDNLSFSSYDEAKKIGVISVNAGGLSRYAVGQRLSFKQDDVVKYAVIVAQTDTTISALMLNGVSLSSSAISEIQVSQSFAPQTSTGTNFYASLLQGQIDGKPVIVTTKNKESDPDATPQEGYVILQLTLADE